MDDEARAELLRMMREFEIRCDFPAAARAARAAGQARDALRLAALGADTELSSELLSNVSPEDALAAAEDLVARALFGFAAPLFERAGNHEKAGSNYEAAGQYQAAAAAFEAAKKPALAAKALETALRRDEANDAARLALGQLLARYGRSEAAVRTLQQIEPTSELARPSFELLGNLLDGLGLREAAHTIRKKLDDLPAAPVAPVGPTHKEETAAAAKGAGEQVMFGRYRITAEVAKTAAARLLEATDLLTGAHVALKLLSVGPAGLGRDAEHRFAREAEALSRLRHPAVVELKAFIPEGPALALAWMSGGDLAEVLKTGPLSPRRAVEIAVAILSALGEAHRLGILHRDVKPSNVLFDAVGAPRLSDFGTAHLSDASTTVTVGALGTFAYMSPEQRLGEAATVQSDLFGVGVMLVLCMTREVPQPAKEGRLDPPASAFHDELDARHDAVLAQLCADKQEERPTDAFAAAKLISSLHWPDKVATLAGPHSSKRPSMPQVGGGRLGPARDPGDGRDPESRFFDELTERHVLVKLLDDSVIEAARHYASTSRAELPLVLSASHADQTLWVLAPRGICLADTDQALSAEHAAALRSALSDLHRAGAAHGSIDREHVYLRDDGVELCFPRTQNPERSPQADLVALEQLSLR